MAYAVVCVNSLNCRIRHNYTYAYFLVFSYHYMNTNICNNLHEKSNYSQTIINTFLSDISNSREPIFKTYFIKILTCLILILIVY